MTLWGVHLSLTADSSLHAAADSAETFRNVSAKFYEPDGHFKTLGGPQMVKNQLLGV